MKKILSFCFLLLFILPASSFSQKAYDAVYYSGKTQDITVKFTLANGYINASEIKTTDNKTKKISRFLPTNELIGKDKKMKFSHFSATGKVFNDYFTLEGMEDDYEKAPIRINGKYYFNGTAFNIVLIKL